MSMRVKRRQLKNVVLVASIDLHGFTKAKGIASLTRFLDDVTSKRNRATNRRQRGDREGNSEIWVLVITGSGAHSNCGPVLRDAVEALLRKREMEFFLNHGKGSFTVNAKSGYVLLPPEIPKDTKVIIRNQPLGLQIPDLPKSSAPIVQSTINPLPAEVAANDAYYEKSRRESQLIASREKKHEHRLVQRAISMSLAESKAIQVKEDELMKRALTLSALEGEKHDIHDDDEDDELRKALELSKYEMENVSYDSEEDELQRVLEASQREVDLETQEWMELMEESERSYQEGLRVHEEIDSSFQEVLRLSVQTNKNAVTRCCDNLKHQCLQTL